MVSIRMAVSGFASRMRRVASMPLTLGMSRSIRITPGRSSSASPSACWPSVASPTSSVSGSTPSMARIPRRKRGGSSARRTRMGLADWFIITPAAGRATAAHAGDIPGSWSKIAVRSYPGTAIRTSAGLLHPRLGPYAHSGGGGSAQDAVGHPCPAYRQQYRASRHRRRGAVGPDRQDYVDLPQQREGGAGNPEGPRPPGQRPGAPDRHPQEHVAHQHQQHAHTHGWQERGIREDGGQLGILLYARQERLSLLRHGEDREPTDHQEQEGTEDGDDHPHQPHASGAARGEVGSEGDRAEDHQDQAEPAGEQVL